MARARARSAGSRWDPRLCEVRKCAVQKSVGTCADCSDFTCAALEKFLGQAPQARKNLETLRKPEA